MTIRVTVFGAPRCHVDGRELPDLPTQRTRFALLIYLAIERDVARDAAAAMFWPDSNDDRARHALSQSLYELKKILGEGWITTQSGRLVVSPKFETDAADFIDCINRGRLSDALPLYRGPFLSGYALPNASEFEQWADRQRAHYQRAHRKARRELLVLFEQQGNLKEATEAARHWVESDPLEDEANHKLIELLATAGARTEALSVYAAYEERLRVELEISPLDETQALVQRIRQPTGFRTAIDNGSASEGSDATIPVASAVSTPKKQLRLWLRRGGIGLGATITALAMVVDVWSILTDGVVRIAPRWQREHALPVTVDTTSIVIFPFEYDSQVKDSLNEDYLIQDALGRLSGINVVDVFQVRAAVGRIGQITPQSALRMASDFGAGRYILGRISAGLADSLRIYAAIYDAARRGNRIAARTRHSTADQRSLEAAFARLADELMFGVGSAGKASELASATYSVPARNAYQVGLEAIRDWDLTAAEQAFATAVRADPEFTPGYLWLAQSRSWLRFDPAQWMSAAEQAYRDRAGLRERDQLLATALFALASGDVVFACETYHRIIQKHPRDFVGWYGKADCLQRDAVVVQDAAEPSGWRFRSSYHDAVTAYRRAFELMPSVHRAFRASNYEPLRKLLKTQWTELRTGSTSGTGTPEFAASPQLRGDTLVFIPYPIDTFHLVAFDPNSITDAVRHQSRVFHIIASTWATAYPESPEATEAVATALELLGDKAALDTLRKARSLTHDDENAIRLATREVFMRLKYSLPHDLKGVHQARVLADSILTSQQPEATSQPALMAALCILTGHVERAIQFMQTTRAIESARIPHALAPAVVPLLVYSSVGAPVDSITMYEKRVDDLINFVLSSDEQDRARLDWLLRPSYVAMPIAPFVHIKSATEDDPLWKAYSALAANDVPAAIRLLSEQRAMRAGVPASQLTLDVLFPEAWLLAASGHPHTAARWLDPTLSSMHAWPPFDRAGELVEVGAWIRAMQLRAELADRTGEERTARLWAAPVVELWKNGDRPVKSAIHHLRAFMN